MWSDPEGFGRLEARLTPDALAVLGACLEPFESREFDRGTKQGRHELSSGLCRRCARRHGEGEQSDRVNWNLPSGRDTLVRMRVDLVGSEERSHGTR